MAAKTDFSCSTKQCLRVSCASKLFGVTKKTRQKVNQTVMHVYVHVSVCHFTASQIKYSWTIGWRFLLTNWFSHLSVHASFASIVQDNLWRLFQVHTHTHVHQHYSSERVCSCAFSGKHKLVCSWVTLSDICEENVNEAVISQLDRGLEIFFFLQHLCTLHLQLCLQLSHFGTLAWN